MVPEPSLHLPARTGLPPEIAYLLGDYPKGGWRGHANFAQLSAFWLHVHDGLRSAGAELQRLLNAQAATPRDDATFQRAFVPHFNHFLQHLTQHHQIEDAAYFPKFRALDARMVTGFDLLEHDHVVIDAALHASLESARRLVAGTGGGDAARFALERHSADSAALLALLRRHLADEEDLVIPAMLRHGERAVS